MWHDGPALAMPEVMFPDLVIRQIPHSLVSCKMQVQQLLGSVLQVHGKEAEISSAIHSSRRERTEQQRQTLCVLVLFLSWTF